MFSGSHSQTTSDNVINKFSHSHKARHSLNQWFSICFLHLKNIIHTHNTLPWKQKNFNDISPLRHVNLGLCCVSTAHVSLRLYHSALVTAMIILLFGKWIMWTLKFLTPHLQLLATHGLQKAALNPCTTYSKGIFIKNIIYFKAHWYSPDLNIGCCVLWSVNLKELIWNLKLHYSPPVTEAQQLKKVHYFLYNLCTRLCTSAEDFSESWTNISNCAGLRHTQHDLWQGKQNSAVYVCVLNIQITEFLLSVPWSAWRQQSTVSCHGLYRGHAGNYCGYCVLLWSEWEELQHHVNSHSSASAVSQSISPTQLIPFPRHNNAIIWITCSGH